MFQHVRLTDHPFLRQPQSRINVRTKSAQKRQKIIPGNILAIRLLEDTVQRFLMTLMHDEMAPQSSAIHKLKRKTWAGQYYSIGIGSPITGGGARRTTSTNAPSSAGISRVSDQATERGS
jgi:hypothetical protein